MGDLTVSDVLSKAADLIEPEGAWTQGTWARRADGSTPYGEISDEDAVCFCALGAIWRVCGAINITANRAEDALGTVLGKFTVGEWNDLNGRTQAEVVAALREASKRASTPPNEPSAAMGGGGG